ncbi:hypothetical protein DA73_0400037750 [Tolypothrix bouteillei VB521301]|uniref:KOW domain-containing protein n=1 Tax=Tolypothrix bouteillei VB521301 TaxID=1479485 RepID=A0A0C1R9Z6_9CYAN|nr:hypothetical protein DA73_0400037750 [Tolypothrix bouteillei VB521301]
MRSAINPKIGDKVLILRPAYVAGKIGEICGQEASGDGTPERWLIRIEDENATQSLVVSLFPKEFEVFKNDFEPF